MRPARDALDRSRGRRAEHRRRILATTAVITVVMLVFIGGLWGRDLFAVGGPPRLAPIASSGVSPSASTRAAPSGPAMIRVRADAVLLDGTFVDDPRPAAAGGRMQRLDGLFRALKERAEGEGAAPERGRQATIDVDTDVAAIVVKSVFQTAAYAGYPNVGFAVTKDAGPAPATTVD